MPLLTRGPAWQDGGAALIQHDPAALLFTHPLRARRKGPSPVLRPSPTRHPGLLALPSSLTKEP